MAKINLKDYYPDYYHEDYIIDAPDEVAELLKSSKRESQNRKRNTSRQHSNYSLDYHKGVETQVLDPVISAEELFLELQTSDTLKDALASLPPVQAKRISLKYFDNLSYAKIAEIEHITPHAVIKSIENALKVLKDFLVKK